MRTTMIVATVVLYAACEGATRQAPPAKVAGVRVVDLIPASLSGETWQDAEPFLALYASNAQFMAASAFTPNPGGSASATAPLYVSNYGGASGATAHAQDLMAAPDHLPDRLVATRVTIPWSNGPTLGQELIGSTLSLAVHPLHGDSV